MRMMSLALILCGCMLAEDPTGKTYSAGGNWTYLVTRDKMSDVLYGLFELRADEDLGDGIGAGRPVFAITCGGSISSAKWIESVLSSPVVLGLPDLTSPLGAPQQIITLRQDGKRHIHFWNIAEDFRRLLVDKGATEEMIRSTDARIQFHDASGHSRVARFSPADLNMDGVIKACGQALK